MSININIKMYRVGELGDCFLLRFSKGTKQSHVLIDCGSFRNGNDSKKRLNDIVADIKTQLGDKPLDVVVGTHQHNDHLSGFAHAEAAFRKIPVENVWLPWLDDPTDPDAVKVQTQHNSLVGLVRTLPDALKESLNFNEEQAGIAKTIEDVLQFYGIDSARAAAGDEPLVPAKGIEVLKTLSKAGDPNYLQPGNVLDLPGLPPNSVKVYVLGPPKDYKDIKDTNPSKGETFDHSLTMALEQTEQFLSALAFNAKKKKQYESGERYVAEAPATETIDQEEHFPFNESKKFYREDECYRPMYLFAKNEMKAKIANTVTYKRYYDDSMGWRTINDNWIEQAETLALYLNNLTNNSSLVLAFEVVATKKVLLFVGDAQTGNWRSWTDISWAAPLSVNKTESLLNNTIFYKVGHHASHNATFKPAFDRMLHPDLMAMIPVDQTDPNITKPTNPWQMPAPNLYKALKKQTKHRIIRMDDGIPTDCQGENPAWEKKVKKTDLYVEISL